MKKIKSAFFVRLRITEGKDKTIILDNVGLYNYFGLLDANKKWRHHFIGSDDIGRLIDKSKQRSEREISDYDFDETKLDEDNEPMMVVRGISAASELNDAADLTPTKDSFADKLSDGGNKDSVLVHKLWSIEEFTLSDYYLVRGNHLKFSIYPFIKKKGTSTQSVGNAVFEYYKPIVLDSDIDENRRIIDSNVKL